MSTQIRQRIQQAFSIHDFDRMNFRQNRSLHIICLVNIVSQGFTGTIELRFVTLRSRTCENTMNWWVYMSICHMLYSCSYIVGYEYSVKWCHEYGCDLYASSNLIIIYTGRTD